MKIVVLDSETDVSPETIRQIQAFKNGLFAAYKDFFLCQQDGIAEGATLQKRLYSKLGLPGPKPDTVEDGAEKGPYTGLYLTDVEINISVVPDSRKLVAIKTIFQIAYGNDAELDIFSPNKNGIWSYQLHWTSPPYATILGAYTNFNYGISPADEKGEWYVAAEYQNPWPSSCWQEVSIDVLRPNSYGDAWRVRHDAETYYKCDDSPVFKAVTENGFEVDFPGKSIEEGKLVTLRRFAYQVDGFEATRVLSPGLNSVSFVDEWVESDWQQAQVWSAVGNRTALHRIHSKLRESSNGDFTALQGCSEHPREQVLYESFVKSGEDGGDWYFLVEKRGDAYRMLEAGHRFFPGCKGRNQLAENK